MSPGTICPSEETLRQASLGLLPAEASLPVERHLLECPACVASFESLEVEDVLLECIRKQTAVLDQWAQESDDLDGLVAHVRVCVGRALEPTLSKASPADVTPAPPDHGDHASSYAFLRPPQSADELGRLGSYRVLGVLGSGGMGVVFEAEDPHLRRRVALKAMKPELYAGPLARQRFLREARAVAALEHDHIVTIYQVGEDAGVPYFAMQLLKGESLASRLQRVGKLPVDESLRLGREMAVGVAAAHACGLIHRDIKPGNIWLEAGRGPTRAKLLDFGLARADGGDVSLTHSAAVLGTPSYMAPEQARNEPLDGRADLFSLGCVLYRAAVGAPAFQGSDPLSVLMSLAASTPTPPSKLAPEVPEGLSDLIMRLLSKDRNDRPASAEAVVDEIREIERQLADERRVSKPSGQMRKRRIGPIWPLAAAIAAASCVIAGIIVIVRDKHGDEVLRASVPRDGGETVRDGGGAVNGTSPAPRKNDSTTPSGGRAASDQSAVDLSASTKSPDAASPMQFPEPVPLSEWLKGRTALTVAQDGTGQFKTIQAALDALRPGQCVRVLDLGPYRENLVFRPPPDSGLIAEKNAIVEVAGPAANAGDPGATYHSLRHADGFRLHGFYFVSAEAPVAHNFGCESATGLVMENCVFQMSEQAKIGLSALLMHWYPGGYGEEPCIIRDCLIDGSFWLGTVLDCDRPFSVIAERNWCRGRQVRVDARSSAFTFVLRHNLIQGQSAPSISISATGDANRFAIINNTVTGPGLTPWKALQLPAHMTVVNNIFTAPTRFDNRCYRLLPQARELWRVSNNLYLKASSEADEIVNTQTDTSDAEPFLSIDPTEADYLRIAPDGVAATSAAGGEWPNHIGALPPGGAPAEGDWLTRLQRRQTEFASRTATAIPRN